MAGNQNSTDVARVFDEPLKEEYKPEISFDKKKEHLLLILKKNL
jgi:hypothetical protein